MDEKLGRMVTRVVLPRVVMHSRHHFGVFDSYPPTIFVYYKIFGSRDLYTICRLLNKYRAELYRMHKLAFSF